MKATLCMVLAACQWIYSDAECREMFFPQKLDPGKALLNHTINSLSLASERDCRRHCYLNHDCVSYNLGPLPTPILRLCELNNADRYQYPHDYQDKPGFSYSGVMSACQNGSCSVNAKCQHGFGPTKYRCVCPRGLEGFHCVDIDECSNNTHNCSKNGTCSNTYSSFNCSCHQGYTGDGYTCTDIDECSSNLHDCDPIAGMCQNTPGSFSCGCYSGFSQAGKNCTDIDECSYNTHNCSKNGTCSNTYSSFNCSCHQGYTGDGYTCTDIDECSSNLHDCDPIGGMCQNTPGSFSCGCYSGYFQAGKNCTDKDECLEDNHNCSTAKSEKHCKNLPGSFKCACNPGFSGDGYNCTELIEEVKANTTPVCVGTKDNTYGRFTLPKTGLVKSFKLVFLSGDVSGKGSEKLYKWGHKDGKKSKIFVTDKYDKRIAPPESYDHWDPKRKEFEIIGQSLNTVNFMYLPEIKVPRLEFSANEEFRVWFGEDLINETEHDNHGETCMDIYVLYRNH